MVLGLLSGDVSIGGIILLFILITFGPLVLYVFMYKMSMTRMTNMIQKISYYSHEAEEKFLGFFSSDEKDAARTTLDQMKDLKLVPPTSLDPAGIVAKLEHILDTVDWKTRQFISGIASEADDEEKENLRMAYFGIHGTHQMSLIMQHIKLMIEKTRNIQLAAMMQMMLPLYDEMAQSQRDAAYAFLDGLPIGDSVGPFVAAKAMTDDGEEIAEDIVHTQEDVDGTEMHVIKSKGPAARLGKYGEAVETIADQYNVDKIITVDAGLRFEGEPSGKVAEGIGVLMGGPGVEKTKIEEVATEYDVPLEGLVVKMSAPQATSIMRKEIYEGGKEAYDRLIERVREDEDAHSVLVIGVGNGSGIGNSRDTVRGLPQKLRKHWKEQGEDEVSLFGLAMMPPFGGGGAATTSVLPYNPLTSFLRRGRL